MPTRKKQSDFRKCLMGKALGTRLTNLYSVGCKWEEIRSLNWTLVRSSSKNTLYLTVQTVFTHLKWPGRLEKSTTTERKEKQLCHYHAWWNYNFIHQTHALIASCVSYLLPYLKHHWRSVPRASVLIFYEWVFHLPLGVINVSDFCFKVAFYWESDDRLSINWCNERRWWNKRAWGCWKVAMETPCHYRWTSSCSHQ